MEINESIFLVHGSASSKDELKELLQISYKDQIVIPSHKLSFSLINN